jgi:hypothetical protein
MCCNGNRHGAFGVEGADEMIAKICFILADTYGKVVQQFFQFS